MKKFKKILMCAAVFMLVFAFSIPAFAANKIIHNGTAKYSYYTTDYVRQRYDNTLTNTTYGNPSGATISVRAFEKTDNGTYISASTEYPFEMGEVIYISEHADAVRNVHLQLSNLEEYYGKSVNTSGTWYLTA